MRILQVLVGAAARTGGPPAFVGDSSVELRKLGVEVRIVATDTALAPWGVIERQRRIRTEEIHPSLAKSDLRLLPARFPRRLAYSPKLAAELRRTAGEFDVVHIHNLWQFPQYAGYRAARRNAVPYVVSPHGALDPYLRRRGRARKALTMRLWQRRMLSEAAAIHLTTAAERDLTDDVLPPSVPKVVVPCGVYVEQFREPPSGDQFRRDRLGGYDGPLILFLGRITDKKGVDVLIRSFARVRSERDCRLAVVGPDDSGLLPKLNALVGELGLAEDDVAFVGPVFGEQRLRALAAADVWALSSHTENFGIAVVEAAAAGCAIVVSPAVNIAPELGAAEAGLVADASPEPFADAILRLLADDAERARFAAAAPGWAARYDWSEVAPRLLEMYREAAAARAER